MKHFSILRPFEQLPENMRTDAVRPYYDILAKRRGSLVVKRLFDLVLSGLLLVLLSPVMAVLALLIVLDSRGGVFYRQERVTTYGQVFRIHKFRTMVKDADKKGTQVTVDQDARITRVGRTIRRFRLDEIPQLIDIFEGKMTFVGTRPEVMQYVRQYTPEMMATLLMPAGLTSEASYRFKDEAELLNQGGDVDEIYVREVLPAKMVYNLKMLREFSLWGDLKVMVKTLLALLH